jgi:hypothetical protein
VNTGNKITKGFLVTGNNDFTNGVVPDLGAGSRLLFYPGKAAFRAGYVNGSQWNNSNTGKYSVALGYNTTASGDFSTAIGYYAVATNLVSAAIGETTTASGNNATAIGFNAIASGTGSTAIGNYATASGYQSIAFGSGATASGSYSTAMGSGTIASSYNSFAMGEQTRAKGYASTVIGMFNDSILTTNQSSATSTTPLLIVGNGNAWNARSNALVVRKDGMVGIGTSYPTNPLSFPAATGKKISLYPGATGDVGFAVYGNQLQIYSDHSNASVKIGYDNSGSFVNNYEVYGNGNAWLRGTLTQNSDARLKTTIRRITGAIQQLMQINGYNYFWKEKQLDASQQTGFLAQEVQHVLPALVKADEKGLLSLNYFGLIPYLVEGVKDQQSQIDALKKENHELKSKVVALERWIKKRAASK